MSETELPESRPPEEEPDDEAMPAGTGADEVPPSEALEPDRGVEETPKDALADHAEAGTSDLPQREFER